MFPPSYNQLKNALVWQTEEIDLNLKDVRGSSRDLYIYIYIYIYISSQVPGGLHQCPCADSLSRSAWSLSMAPRKSPLRSHVDCPTGPAQITSLDPPELPSGHA